MQEKKKSVKRQTLFHRNSGLYISAITVSAGSDHEQLEPSTREQEVAWGFDVS